MIELPKHLKYNPCPEIVRTHEQWQSAIRQAVSQLQTMGHVRAPEAIATTVMPLFAHLDALVTLLQADLGAYAEQVMALSQEGAGGQEVLVGLHPQDAEALVDLTDQIHSIVESVAKGLKEGSKPREQLEGVLSALADLSEAVMSASLEEDEVPDEEEDAQRVAMPSAAPTAPAAPEADPLLIEDTDDVDLSDEPLHIA